MTQNDFASLGLGDAVCRAVAELGFETPTPIQTQSIPELLDGHDLLGIAQTGTGKTAAFALPIIDRLHAERVQARRQKPVTLILAPTRELAAQIHDEVASFSSHTRLRHACIFGGVGQNPQVKALKHGVDILMATPGRLLDLQQQGFLDLSEVSHLVLDEADRLLDMGFIRDVKKIIALLPKKRQSLLFSATMPSEVAALADEMLIAPVRVEVSPKKVTVELIEQHVAHVANEHKQGALTELLRNPEVSRAIVFTRTKHGANRVAKKLNNAGIGTEAIHGNKSQNARTRALASFKAGEVWVLVATDIAARGIDIDDISHVINFELPHEPESYVHRIGRTARAGASGVAWSLVDPSEVKRLRAIERLTKLKLPTFTIEGTESAEVVERSSDQGGANRAEDAPRKKRRRRRRRARPRNAA